MDTYRLERDFFYDPDMHGVNWNAMKPLLRAARRCGDPGDVDYVIGEMIGELNVAHVLRRRRSRDGAEAIGRDARRRLELERRLPHRAHRARRPVGLRRVSPLGEPGVDVKEGDYLLAVNGVPSTRRRTRGRFQGLGKKTRAHRQRQAATDRRAPGGRHGSTSETELRYRAWIEEHRQYVDKATGGKVGYIYVPSTGIDGQNDLVRQFIASGKEGLIIDERWNSGGQIPARFIELLNRPILTYWAGATRRSSLAAGRAPRAEVMLINGWSGSGGDAFPFYFREAGSAR